VLKETLYRIDRRLKINTQGLRSKATINDSQRHYAKAKTRPGSISQRSRPGIFKPTALFVGLKGWSRTKIHAVFQKLSVTI
jgi:hypothetical protein